MGWGNVSHALALARTALVNAGITEPTTADLQAALLGGDVTTADGKTVTLAGVLQQRAAGMGWGRIAASYGTTMGAVNRDLRKATTATTDAPTAPAATRTAAVKASTSSGVTTAAGSRSPGKTANPGHGTRGLATAAGAPEAPGLTTAAGTPAASHGGKGLATAGGATGAQGAGHAYGRGIVTASGATLAPTTGLARGGAAGVVSAGDPGAAGRGAERGNGKGKGGG
jgi:hypothetical protein